MPNLIKTSTLFSQIQQKTFFGFVVMTGTVKFVAAVFLSLVLLASGLSFIAMHQLYSERENARVAAQSVLSYAEELLAEASDAAKSSLQAQQVLCSGSMAHDQAFLLNHYPHIQAISFVQGNMIGCSSLTVAQRKKVPPALLSNNALKEASVEKLLFDMPTLYYLANIQNNTLLVNISTSFINNAFNLDGVLPNMYLQIGGAQVWSDGSIIYASGDDDHFMHLRSATFPVSVAWQSPLSIPWYRFIAENSSLIAFAVLVSTLCGYLFWRLTGHFTSSLMVLQQAISQRQIHPFYQPFFQGDTGKIAGFEVLARWKHPVYGYVSPDIFIPLAEQHNLIGPLTRLLMQQITTDFQKAIHLFPDGLYICINISAQNCLDPHFEMDINDMMRKLEAKKRHIVVEVTERHPLHVTPQLNEWLAALRRANISVALDDFGTGYSNLAYICALQPEFLKIDKMFVSQIDNNTDTRLVESVIDLAKKMRLKVIAEGVETQAQVDYLRAKNVDFMQGYFFCRPLPAEDFIKRMRLEVSAPPSPA